MSYNIGLNVIEVDGTGAPAIVGASTSVAALSLLTQRGLANKPVAVTSFAQFVSQFGSYFPGGLGAYLVKGFFDNGGQTAWIKRVVATSQSSAAQAATTTLKDGIGVSTLQVDAGYRGFDDPGIWGNGLFVSTAANQSEALIRLRETQPASVTGTVVLPATFDISSAMSVQVTVDNESSATVVTFVASDFPGGATAATPQQVINAINGKTQTLVASLAAGGQLTLTSTGAIAKLQHDFTRIQVSAANAPLGLAVMAAPNVGIPAVPTPTGAQLADASAFSVGDAVNFSDGSKTAFAKLMTVDPVGGAVTWAPAVPNIGTFDPVKLQISRVTFNLTIALGGIAAANVVETWNALSMEPDVANYAMTIVNSSLFGSKYVTLTDLHSKSGAGADVPAAVAFTSLQKGADGVPTPNDFIAGFASFDPIDVQLFGCERTDPAITTAALAYCADRGDCTFVGAVPQGFVAAGQAIAYGQAFQGKKVYGALYGPWIVVTDPAGQGNNPTKTLTPVGHVMGVYARIANTRGFWKAPAGDEANLVGVLDVETPLSDTDHTALVKQGSVNGIRSVPGSGVIIDASRSLSTDTRWLYINVRLLFNYVKSSLKTGLRWVRQEPNRSSLWDAIKFQTVTPFLLGLWRQGAFGTGTPAQVFTVICDATNNPPDQVDQGNLTVEIYFYPSKPAETIIIIVGQQPSGATASES